MNPYEKATREMDEVLGKLILAVGRDAEVPNEIDIAAFIGSYYVFHLSKMLRDVSPPSVLVRLSKIMGRYREELLEYTQFGLRIGASGTAVKAISDMMIEESNKYLGEGATIEEVVEALKKEYKVEQDND